MNKKKGLVLILAAALIIAFFTLDGQRYFSWQYFLSIKADLINYNQAHPFIVGGSYFLLYVIGTLLSLPIAAVLTLAGGAIFGLLWGTLIVSFASSIGALCAFLLSRFLFRDSLQSKFAKQLSAINKGVEREGRLYLFSIRMVPLFPFFMVNLLMGLTPMRAWPFYWVSQIGMLPGTAVYVNAGLQLGNVSSLKGIVSPTVLISFAILGIFPILAKSFINTLRMRKKRKAFKKPKHFDYNLIAIGGGAAGLVTSYIGAAVKAKVALIESNNMGGDCLNTGCVPSKALIQSAKHRYQLIHADRLGYRPFQPEVNFKDIMARVKRIIATVEPHDSVERYSKLGVECITGQAVIKSPYEIEVNGKVLTTRSIVLATGAKPFVPAIDGLEEVDFVTSDTLWELDTLPTKLLVLGGGPVGCELAQCFARLGSDVTLVEMGNQLLGREDSDVAAQVMQALQADGVDIKLNCKAVAFHPRTALNSQQILDAQLHDQTIQLGFDVVLLALGRRANVQGFGLDGLNIPLNENGTIAVNDKMQTIYPNIYACGDVAGPYQFTHAASHQAWFSSVNALFGCFKQFKINYDSLPWVTFTDPEVARVGLNEQQALAEGIAYDRTIFELDELDRAITEDSREGFVQVLTAENSDKILGVTIVAKHAGEMLAEFVLAMRHGLGLNKILSTIHAYPTWVEGNKYAAGEWKRSKVKAYQLKWLERFHRWRRGNLFLNQL